MKKTLKLIKSKPVLAILIIILIFVGVYFLFFKSKDSVASTIVIHPKDFIQKLSVSGTVEASENADLGFAQSGRISGVYANVGDSVTKGMVLAKIENGDLEALLLQKQSVLDKERANLSTKRQGTRPEQLALTTQKYKDALSAYVATLHNSYFQIEDAFLLKADTLFTRGTLNIPADSWNDKRSIEGKREAITFILKNWKIAIDNINSLDNVKSTTLDVLNKSKELVNDLTRITGNLNTSIGYSQTSIDLYRSTINGAGQQISTVISTINTSESTLNNAQNSLTIEQAGSTQYDIDAQIAVVKAAEADVLSAQAQVNKTIVVAPFPGIVTKMNAKVGEIATSNTSDISINGIGLFIIKSNIPEVYISSLEIGNTATATLDAYGSDIFFPLRVTAIDPAQTVVNGVSNYKTTLQFSPVDKVIRPGMTANIEITTQKVPNAIVIPRGCVFTQNEQQFVQIKKGSSIVTRAVITGSVLSVGEVNIVSGLDDGDIVLLNPIIK